MIINSRISLIIFLSLIIYISQNGLFAQPPVEWLRMYDGGRNESFNDIYKVSQAGYIACGVIQDRFSTTDTTADFWVVRIDNQGDEIWAMSFGDDGVRDMAYTIIEADNGDFITAGEWGRNAAAVRINGDGDQIWQRSYATGEFKAVIELKSGEFLLAGRSEGQGYLVCINGNGNVIWDNLYGDEDSNYFVALRETDGGVVVIGNSYIRNEGWSGWAVKVEPDGDVIWNELYAEDSNNTFYGMASTEDGGFVMTGKVSDGQHGANHPNIDVWFMKIDGDSNLEWSERFDFEGAERGTCVERLSNGGYVIVGWESIGSHPLAVRINTEGALRWSRLYEFEEEDGFAISGHHFLSVVEGHDRSILAAGITNFTRDGSAYNGLLIKLEPESLGPIIFYWSPEDTVFSVLPADTVQFIVRARDQLGQEMSYRWIVSHDSLGVDTMGTDTTLTVQFDLMGLYTVQCQVSNEEFTSTITWHVSVREFVIDYYSPRNLTWSVRRPSEIDFSIGVRALEGVEPNYRWELTDRDEREIELGDEDRQSYLFDLKGIHHIRGIAFNDDNQQSVQWTIEVNSVLQWWTPHERQFEVELNDQVAFVVIPFDPESPRISFQWLVNGEVEEEIEDDILYTFNSVGNYVVTAIVRERARVDTVLWRVRVVDPNTVIDDIDGLLPTEVTLYPAAPNPFNSTTSIRYFLPHSANVRLTVYDSAGRFVQTLNDDLMATGEHQTILSGTDLSTGVYLLRLEAGIEVHTLKIVLLK